MPSPWVVLGLKTDSSAEDIRRRYRSLALQWHPDKNLDRQEFATNRMIEIQEAYEKILNNDDARAIVRGSSVPTPFSYTTPKAYSNWNYTQGQAQRPKRKEKPKPKPQSKTAAKPKAAPKPNARPESRPTPVPKQSEPTKPAAAAAPVNPKDPVPSASYLSAAKARVNYRARAKAQADAEKTAPSSSTSVPPDTTHTAHNVETPPPTLTCTALCEMCMSVCQYAITIETRGNAFIHRYTTFNRLEHLSLINTIISKAIEIRVRVGGYKQSLQDHWMKCLNDDAKWFKQIKKLRDVQRKTVHWFDRASHVAWQLNEINLRLGRDMERDVCEPEWIEELDRLQKIAEVVGEFEK